MTIERGRQLVQSSGCLKCHLLKLEDRCPPDRSPICPRQVQQGCVADKSSDDSGRRGSASPNWSGGIADIRRERSGIAGPRHSRGICGAQSRNLHCAECHGKFEGFPPFDILGGN